MTMRQAYENYTRLYGDLVSRGSVDDAMLRGAFAAGVVHGLSLARLETKDALAAVQRMSAELDSFWAKDPPS